MVFLPLITKEFLGLGLCQMRRDPEEACKLGMLAFALSLEEPLPLQGQSSLVCSKPLFLVGVRGETLQRTAVDHPRRCKEAASE